MADDDNVMISNGLINIDAMREIMEEDLSQIGIFERTHCSQLKAHHVIFDARSSACVMVRKSVDTHCST
jgi:hypothetical protein